MSVSVKKEDRAKPAPQTRAAVKEALRRCLMCGEDFLSDGPGNRICKKCKSTETWRRG